MVFVKAIKLDNNTAKYWQKDKANINAILDLFYGTMHLLRGTSAFLSAECFVPGLYLCQWGIVHLRCVDLPPFAVTIQFHQATINNFLRTLINH